MEVFWTFLKLGLTSFGGPIAHLGYFRDELVTRRRWLNEKAYGELVALCQFLPGPASSQVGFALGLMRAGPLGAFAAWAAFTLPSALVLVLFATAVPAFDTPAGTGLLHGLKLVAVAVVTHAVWGMAKSLTPDRTRVAIALAAAFAVAFAGTFGQIVAILSGALLGLTFCQRNGASDGESVSFNVSKTVGTICLIMFVLLLLLLPIAASMIQIPGIRLFDAFYRSGSLVFGGGHVVLPLLETETVQRGWLTDTAFLAGYGMAQAIPGPLFTFAAYLGAIINPTEYGLLGAMIGLIAIFLPGLLLLVGTLPYWNTLSRTPLAQAAMRGANAAVVGVLGAALYNPVWVSAVFSPVDFALVVTGFMLLNHWRMPPWTVVGLLAICGAFSQLL